MEDQFDFTDVVLQALGDLVGGQALVGQLIDAPRAGVEGFKA